MQEGHMDTIGDGVGIDMEGTSPFQAPQIHEKAHSGSHTLHNHSAEMCRWLRRGGREESQKARLK